MLCVISLFTNCCMQFTYVSYHDWYVYMYIVFQSPVMSVAFSKFHPNYVIGGTYSGQIVLWDTRSGKRTPIQRSPLSSSAHTHPIYSLDVVGSQNAHNLISVSTDGKMCSWNLDMLSQPQVRKEYLTLLQQLNLCTMASLQTLSSSSEWQNRIYCTFS